MKDDEPAPETKSLGQQEETPLNAFILDENTEFGLKGDWNVVKKEKKSNRNISNNVGSTRARPVHRTPQGKDAPELGGGQLGNSNSRIRSAARPVSRSNNHQQASPGITKLGVQSRKDFEFIPEDYPAMPSKPLSPPPANQSKYESEKRTTIPTTLLHMPSLKSNVESVTVDTKPNTLEHEPINNSMNSGTEDELVAR